MIVTCPNCTTRLQLDEAKVPARPFSVRCPKCQQIVNAQPPAASPQPDALAAVAGLPASNRAQQQEASAGAAHVLREEPAGEASQPPRAGAEEGEVLRLLASLLRGGAEGVGAKASGRRTAWERRLALVCTGSAYGEEVARSLAGGGYEVFAAGSAAQALERLREGGVDAVVLDPEFDLARQGAAAISREMSVLRMPERRRVVFVMLSDRVRTGDAHAAFLAGANLVVNLSEAAQLPRALERNVRDLNELYRDFNRALGLAEL
jgi:predicted Zn finger-like uncharacterized protein